LSEQEILEHYRNSKYYLASHFGPKTNCREDPGSCIDYGLVGYWSFDEGAGTTAYDASGKGNNGTLVNGPKWTNGKFGQALSFDGVDDYVEVPNSSLLNPDYISVVAWIYPKDITNLGFIVSKGEYAFPPYRTYDLLVRDGDIRWQISRDGNESRELIYPLPSANTWYFVVGTYDGNVINLYLNGLLVKTLTNIPGTLYKNTYPLRIGRHVTLPGFFKGLIHEVCIYNRALSTDEISWNYKNFYNPVRDGLVLCLIADPQYIKDIDGDGRLEWIDLSGYNNHGKIYGATLVDLYKSPVRTLQAARTMPVAR
jgi:hypothetical protein